MRLFSRPIRPGYLLIASVAMGVVVVACAGTAIDSLAPSDGPVSSTEQAYVVDSFTQACGYLERICTSAAANCSTGEACVPSAVNSPIKVCRPILDAALEHVPLQDAALPDGAIANYCTDDWLHPDCTSDSVPSPPDLCCACRKPNYMPRTGLSHWTSGGLIGDGTGDEDSTCDTRASGQCKPGTMCVGSAQSAIYVGTCKQYCGGLGQQGACRYGETCQHVQQHALDFCEPAPAVTQVTCTRNSAGYLPDKRYDVKGSTPAVNQADDAGAEAVWPLCPSDSPRETCVYYQSMKQICDCDSDLLYPGSSPDGGSANSTDGGGLEPTAQQCIKKTNPTSAALACGQLIYIDHGVPGPSNCLKEEKDYWDASNAYILAQRKVTTQNVRITAQRNNLAQVQAAASPALTCDSESKRRQGEAGQQEALNEQTTKLAELTCNAKQAWNNVGEVMHTFNVCNTNHAGLSTNKCGTGTCTSNETCVPLPPVDASGQPNGQPPAVLTDTNGAKYFSPGTCIPTSLSPKDAWASCTHTCIHTLNKASDCNSLSDCAGDGKDCLPTGGNASITTCQTLPQCQKAPDAGPPQLCNTGSHPPPGAIRCPTGTTCHAGNSALTFGWGVCY